jgi:hypothetical protein
VAALGAWDCLLSGTACVVEATWHFGLLLLGAGISWHFGAIHSAKESQASVLEAEVFPCPV